MVDFTALFYDNVEAMCAHVPGDFKWKKNPMGTWLLDILNCNIDDVEKVLLSFPVQQPKDQSLLDAGYLIVTEPTKEEYKQIVSRYSFIESYPVSEWADLYFEIISQHGSRCLRDVLSEAKDILEILDDHPEYMNHAFLRRYILNGIVNSECSYDFQSYRPEFPLTDEEYTEMENAPLSKCMEISYRHFCNGEDREPNRFKYTIHTHRIEGVLYASLFEVARCGKVIKKCKNCGRYFIPENRSDTLYCSNPSPVDPTKTCREYGSQRLWYERQKDDELATLSRNILSAKSMLAKRNSDISDYKLSYDYFRKERINWKKAVESGKKTREEYREWLLRMQGQKVIKEAVNGLH